MDYPKISIVTPSYNQGKYIEQTIQSVLNQNYPNLEYIIIDGGSTDETVEIIKKYEHKIHYWVSEPDKGQTDAINKGFDKCTGEIFNWINSDDFYEPNTFSKISNLFFNNPLVNIICGKEWGFEDLNPASKTLHKGSIIKNNIFETIRIGIIDQPCTFFRLTSISLFFPLDISLKYVMDKELWWKYLLKYGQSHILKVEDVFTHFRLHQQSKTVNDASLFELEFKRLEFSLFLQLDAPYILKNQLPQHIKPICTNWPIEIKNHQFILAEFAAHYAERNYIGKRLPEAALLIKYVKSIKKYKMNKKEWRLWFLVTIIPSTVLNLLKKVKGMSLQLM